MPWRFGRVRLIAAGTPAQARLRITQAGPRSVAADILLLDADRAPLAELLDCWFVAVALKVTSDPAQRCLSVDLVAAPDPAALPLDTSLLDVAIDKAAHAEGDPVAAALADSFVSARADTALRRVTHEQTSQEAAPLRARLLDWLRQDGIAEADGTLMPSAGLPPAEELLRSLLFDIPVAGADAALLAAAGEALEAVLQAAAPRPQPPAALLDQFLFHGPAGRQSLDCLIDAAVEVVRSWPTGRALSVLEISAGGSTVTRMLARRLNAVRPGLRYVVATTAALQPALTGIDGVTTQIWTPGATEPHGFDLVLSLHGLTRFGFGITELAGLRDRLSPGALLLASEPLPNRLWDLIGVPATDGTPVVPLAAEAWTERLALAGFNARSGALAPSTWPSVLLAAQSIAVRCELVARPERLLLAAPPDDALADELTSALRREGAAVARIIPDEARDAGLLAGAAGLILFLPDAASAADAADWLGRIAALVEPLVGATVPLTLVSRGDARGEAFAAAVGGLRRVLANEAAGLRVRSIRLARDAWSGNGCRPPHRRTSRARRGGRGGLERRPSPGRPFPPRPAQSGARPRPTERADGGASRPARHAALEAVCARHARA